MSFLSFDSLVFDSFSAPGRSAGRHLGAAVLVRGQRHLRQAPRLRGPVEGLQAEVRVSQEQDAAHR